MGQTNHHRLPTKLCNGLGNCLVHSALSSNRRFLQDHTGAGRAVPAVIAAEAENRIQHTSPLHQNVGCHAIVLIGLPDLRSILRGQKIGFHNGRKRLAAIHGRIKHGAKTAAQIIILMVAKGGHIKAHGTHHPKLQRLGGVSSLEQRTHGKIAAVHQNRIRVDLALFPDLGHQPGIAAIFSAILIHSRKEMGMQVMSKEDGGIFSRFRRIHTTETPHQHQRSQCQSKKSFQQNHLQLQ